jgi:hypothetical protein
MKTQTPNSSHAFSHSSSHSPVLIGGMLVVVAAFAALALLSDWAMVVSARGIAVKADTQADAESVEEDCRYCGVVESVRRLAPVGKALSNYEFTIRMGGERHLIQDSTSTKWRPGERMILIAGPLAQPK